MKEITLQDGIHFVDLRRFRSFRTGNCQLMIERTGFLIFARRGKAGSVPGFVSLVADRLRAVRSFKARLANVPVSAAAVRRDRERAGFILPVRSGALSPFFGRIGRIGRMVWTSEITVARWEMLAVLALGCAAMWIVMGMVAGTF
jgi:hypothetical protein